MGVTVIELIMCEETCRVYETHKFMYSIAVWSHFFKMDVISILSLEGRGIVYRSGVGVAKSANSNSVTASQVITFQSVTSKYQLTQILKLTACSGTHQPYGNI